MQSAHSLRLRISLLMQEKCPIPVYFGFDYLPELIQRREKGEPFIFMDHAYFGRGYQNGNFRVLYQSIHRTNELDVPNDRRPEHPKPWKQGDQIFVIPIAPNIAEWHGAHEWTTRTVKKLKQYTDRDIIVKPKQATPMANLLHRAWAVVAHSSVAAVEAAYFGVPVFGPKTSPAWPVSEPDLSKIETPRMPKRAKWLNTLGYSQFTLDEIASGKAWAVIKEIERI